MSGTGSPLSVLQTCLFCLFYCHFTDILLCHPLKVFVRKLEAGFGLAAQVRMSNGISHCLWIFDSFGFRGRLPGKFLPGLKIFT